MKRRRSQGARDFPRMARVDKLLREILGEELERLDDDRLDLVTVTAVTCDRDLRRATVYYDNLRGAEADEELLAALAELRPRLQAAVNRQARLKCTPELRFEPDLAVRSADRIEQVLRELHQPGDDDA
ncbi:MAG: 30S ribosome-binding factor RbfA [Actinomycetota bacterium]|nr:30S ribosome-binding factor RbfA [Actinomycetota bacterium]